MLTARENRRIRIKLSAICLTLSTSNVLIRVFETICHGRLRRAFHMCERST